MHNSRHVTDVPAKTFCVEQKWFILLALLEGKFKFLVEVGEYMLLAGWEVRIGKNCDRGLEYSARGRRPRAAFSSLRSQFFPIRTDPKPANNIFIFFFLP